MPSAQRPPDDIPVPRSVLVRLAVALMDSEELIAFLAPTLAIELVELVVVVEDLLHPEEP